MAVHVVRLSYLEAESLAMPMTLGWHRLLRVRVGNNFLDLRLDPSETRVSWVGSDAMGCMGMPRRTYLVPPKLSKFATV